MYSRSHFIFFMLGLICLVGCQQSKPVGTTLSLTYESADTSTSYVNFKEVISVSGLIPVPQPGFLFYYPTNESPSAAIGCTVHGKSYKIIGQTLDIPTYESIRDVATHLNDVVNAADEACLAILSIAEERRSAQIEKREVNSELVKRLTERRSAAHEKYVESKSKYEVARMNPGLIVARWSTANSSSSRVQASGVAGVSSSRASLQSGYIVMGGIRLSTLFLSDDLFKVAREGAKSKPIVKDIAVRTNLVTHTLQTKHLIYINDRRDESGLSASLSLKLRSFGDIKTFLAEVDRVDIAFYADSVRNIGVGGSFSGLKWSYHPVEFYNESSKVTNDDLVPEYLLVGNSSNNAATSDGWVTVVAQMPSAGWLSRIFPSKFIGE